MLALKSTSATSVFQPKWRSERVHLSFWAGPLRLAEPVLHLLVTDALFDEPLTSLASLAPLAQQPLNSEDGYLLFAHHIEGLPHGRNKVGPLLSYVTRIHDRFVADLTLGPEAYWAQLSGKTRETLRRKIRQFAKSNDGLLDWRCYKSVDEVLAFHRLAMPLAQRTYQHQLFKGGLQDSADFIQKIKTRAERNEVRAYLLFIGEIPVAYIYCEAENNILSYNYVGYDANYSSLSPGAVLMASAIEALQTEHRFRWMDFGHGEGQHKSIFSTTTVHVANVYLLKFTWSNRLLLAFHSGFEACMLKATSVLKKHQWHERLRRKVRQLASKH